MAQRKQDDDLEGCLGCLGVIAFLVACSGLISFYDRVSPVTFWAVMGAAGAALVVLAACWFRWDRRERARQAVLDEQHRVATLRALDTLEALLELTPDSFEYVVSEVLEAHGYGRLSLTTGSGDHGVDLIGEDQEGRRTIVQCKRYAPTAKVGSPAVRDLAGARQLHEADRAIFVTTSSYSKAAIQTAVKCEIELIDGDELVTLHHAAFADAK